MSVYSPAQSRFIVMAVAALAMVILLANTVYVVDQRTQAVVLRFGLPVRTVNAFEHDPGLKLKLPWETVLRLDRRNQPMEAEKEEIIAADQERLDVEAFLRYRISDPIQFYRTLRDERTADDRLQRLVNSSVRQVLGSTSSQDIVSGRRAELMRIIRRDVAARAQHQRLGIEVIDVRIKRADLPQANQQAVYRRMQTSRQQQAAQIRAVGEQQKREIIAGADRDVAITLATATEAAEKLRGEGEARRASLFAHSFGRDPAFAAFYRSLQAYDTALGQGDTTMVLSPQSEFFKVFENGPGGGGGRK